jgi:hypothetical protein
LEEIKHESITPINNQKYLNDLKKELLEEQEKWKTEISSFCEEFQNTQGKVNNFLI